MVGVIMEFLFAVRMEGDNLSRVIANPVYFHQLQACYLLWGQCQFQPVLYQFPCWANYFVGHWHGHIMYLHLHIGADFVPVLGSHPTQSHSGWGIIEMYNLLADNISLHNKYFHGHVWPSTPHIFAQDWGRFPLSVLGCTALLLCIYSSAGTRCQDSWAAGILQADHLGGPASWRIRLAGIWLHISPAGSYWLFLSLDVSVSGL